MGGTEEVVFNSQQIRDGPSMALQHVPAMPQALASLNGKLSGRSQSHTLMMES